jgi:mannose-6-phosphate isomerase-like protein (cupin superfamily)
MWPVSPNRAATVTHRSLSPNTKTCRRANPVEAAGLKTRSLGEFWFGEFWFHCGFASLTARPKSESKMADTSVTKVDSNYSPEGSMGQIYLASGVTLGMRLWRDEPPHPPEPAVRRDYEVVGYVLEGRAELELERQKVQLKKGDSYVIPRGAEHRYQILEPFSAVEATAPPAHVHGRDELPLPSE